MKTKKQVYLFLSAFLFLSIFFIKIDKVNAACEDIDAAFNQCLDSSETSNCDMFYNQWVQCMNSQQDDPETTGESTSGLDVSDMTMDGAYNTDCSDYKNTRAISGKCECYDGYARINNGSCCAPTDYACLGSDIGAPAGCANGDYSCVNNGANNNSSNSGRSAGTAGSVCSDSSPCNSGYVCDSSNTCMVDGFFSGTECKSDGDCANLYGAGYACKGIFVSSCEKVTSSFGSGGSSSSAPIATTTAPITTKNGTYPANSQVMPNGSLLNAQGQTIAPAGTIQIQGSGLGSGFVMCGNGILAPECRDANGNTVSGAPVVVLGASATGNGGLGNTTGASGVAAPKCGTGFQDIGGICFPTNTGLSNTPIYVIISNIFSWLMGLFTTLAVLAFVISGVQYFMASGNEDLAETAKGNAVNAVIGIIVGLSGFIIIKAIAAALSGQSMFF